MSNRLRNARACALVMLSYGYSGVMHAETPPKTEKAPDQMEGKDRLPSAAVFNYSSVFDNYIPFDYLPEIGWREANDNVGEIGGWRSYARIVQEEADKQAQQENQAGEQ